MLAWDALTYEKLSGQTMLPFAHINPNLCALNSGIRLWDRGAIYDDSGPKLISQATRTSTAVG